MWGVATLVFFAMRLVPGNVAYAVLGPDATANNVHQFIHRLGLDRPLMVQYWNFIKGVAHGQLGSSLITSNSVDDLIRAVLPYTLELGAAAVLIAVIAGNALGILAAAFKDRFPDVVVRIVSLALLSFPGFYLGVLVVF